MHHRWAEEDKKDKKCTWQGNLLYCSHSKERKCRARKIYWSRQNRSSRWERDGTGWLRIMSNGGWALVEPSGSSTRELVGLFMSHICTCTCPWWMSSRRPGSCVNERVVNLFRRRLCIVRNLPVCNGRWHLVSSVSSNNQSESERWWDLLVDTIGPVTNRQMGLQHSAVTNIELLLLTQSLPHTNKCTCVCTHDPQNKNDIKRDNRIIGHEFSYLTFCHFHAQQSVTEENGCEWWTGKNFQKIVSVF